MNPVGRRSWLQVVRLEVKVGVCFFPHDTNLLDLDLRRRDEVWFAEKNKSGATEIYSLADFKVRSDLRVDKGYLHGRFGAIPMLGGMERLFPMQRPDEEPVNS